MTKGQIGSELINNPEDEDEDRQDGGRQACRQSVKSHTSTRLALIKRIILRELADSTWHEHPQSGALKNWEGAADEVQGLTEELPRTVPSGAIHRALF